MVACGDLAILRLAKADGMHIAGFNRSPPFRFLSFGTLIAKLYITYTFIMRST